MRVDLAVYSGLVAAGLGLAYWASLPMKSGETDGNKVAVFAVDPKAVQKLVLKSADGEVTAIRRSADGGGADNRFWIEFNKSAPIVPIASASTGPSSTPSPEVKAPVESIHENFLSNEKIKELLDSLNPLEAQRAIGVVTDAQLVEYGLKDSKDNFEINTANGNVFNLVLGKRSYGSQNRFALYTTGKGSGAGDGKVLLINGDPISDLEKANIRLYERNLLETKMDEITKAEVKAGAKVKRMAHIKRDAGGNLQWSDDAENAAANATYKSWFDKLDRLRLLSFANDEQKKAIKDIAPFLEVIFLKDEKPVDRMVFRKSKEGDQDSYWVDSDFLKGTAKLAAPRIAPIEKDLPTVFGN